MHKNRILWLKKSFSLAEAPLLASLVFIIAHTPIRAGELPVPDFTRTWRGASIVTDRSSAHYMHIDAPGNTILSWQSFNVGEGDRVHFEQSSTSDIALNRIFQGTPSEISGRIDALGRIYLINQNGIIFKQGAQINVHTLLASSLALNIDESRLLEGEFNFANLINEGEAAFDSAAFANYDENYTSADGIGEIILNQGVRINTPEGGQVLLFGSRVLNGGDIHARSGQVLLGASEDKIYLTPSTDNSLRGFLIELGNGGEVANLDTGRIVSERGNISLAGLAVNQNGTLQATTSVFENGSIRLLARDQARPVATSTINSGGENARLRLGIDLPSVSSVTPENHAIATRGGRVTLGEGSLTGVSADASDTASAPNEQAQLASSVEIAGRDIRLEKNALVQAVSADVVLHAARDPDKTAIDETGLLRAKQSASIVMEQGSRIDVSGSTDTLLDMQRNQIQVQLTENFLRDTPLQREGVLRGETIYVDVREGTTLGDISDNVNAINRGLSERLSSGGDINLVSSGAIDLQRGSEIDISAGQITYRDGFLNTSQLVSRTGELTSIADADIEQTYLGLFGSVKVESLRWGSSATRNWQMFSDGSASRRFNQGYTQGQKAGGLLLQTHALTENGRVSADSLSSEAQRSQTGSGGRLDIILGNTRSGQRAQNALISGIAQQQTVTDSQLQNYLQNGEDFSAPQWELELDDAFFEQSGLSRFSLTSNGELRIAGDAQISMVEGGEFKANTYGITLDGQVDIVSGDVSLQSRDALTGRRGADLLVNGRIDVSGNWVNDSELLVKGDALLAPISIDAGRISLGAEDADLVLSETSQLRANAGAWQNRGGQLKLGEAGEISLETTSPAVSDIVLDGKLQAYGFSQGGVLDITANRIHIADQFTGALAPGELQLNSAFFRKGGFSDYRLTSTHSDLHVDAQTRLTPGALSTVLKDNFFLQQSQRDVSGIVYRQFQPDYLRSPTHLTLQANDSAGQADAGGGLKIEKGARIVLDPGSRLNLNSTRPIILSGDIINPGGNVDIRLGVAFSTNGFQADQGIWLDGLIDVRGVFIEEPSDTDTRHPGRLLDSGNVSVTADTGFIVLTENSLTEVSARSTNVDVPVNGATGTASEFTSQQVSIEAGGIHLTAAEGLLIAGDVQGQGVAGSAGGAFSIDLNTANRGAGIATDFTQQARVLNIVSDRSALPVATPPAGSLDNTQTGQGWIAADTLNQGGFDRISLKSRNNRANLNDARATGRLVFQGDINLHPAQSLTVQAPIIAAGAGSQISLSAPYVLLGTPRGELLQPANVALAGDARLSVQAGVTGQQGLLDFAGRSVLQGFDRVDLSSEGDIRLRGYADLQDGFRIKGGIEHVGDLQLSADQVYASTLTEFDIQLLDGAAPSSLSINGRGPDSPVLSAGSVLNLDAANIEQQGVLKAPLGTINFNARNRLLLADNSTTSVSGEGQLIPFGSTQGQGRWVYPQSSTRVRDISAAPEKRIRLNSPDIQIADSAALDLSGGGDLYAWEFVPGIGGSTDTLAPQNGGGAFAIIPDSGAFSAYDNYYWGESGATVSPGEQIYLGESEYLAEGLYAIMPARYALLPGAVLVTAQEDFQNINPETRLARVDGGEVIAGQSRFAGSSLNNRRWNGYLVETGERLRQRSEYFETTASRFFREQARANNTPLPVMPEDAASLDIVANNNLLLAGQIRSDPGQFNWSLADGTAVSQQGRGSRLNISGDYLRVLDEVDEQGGIQLLADNLNGLNIESIMLGGTRSQVSGGTQLEVNAQQIDIEAGLQLSELILAATQQINVNASTDKTGAPVDTVSTRDNLLPSNASSGAIVDEVLLVEGDGALLRASSAPQVSVLRSNESAAPVQGLINIAQGASVSVGQSLLLDASADTRVQGDIQLNGGSLNVGASQISIGRVPQNNRQSTTPGLVFSEVDINRMNANELILTSRGSVSLYSGEGETGDLDLQFNNLVIEAASLDGFQKNGQTASITVNETLRLGNRLGGSVSPPAQGAQLGTGDLAFSANRIEFSGENNAAAQPQGLAVRGFANADFNAQTLVVQGQGQLQFEVTDNVRLNAAKITAETAAQYQLLADNARLTLASNPAVAPPALNNPGESVGASLTLQAQSIVHQGTIDIASGNVRLVALEGDIRLENRALIDVSGVARNFAGTPVLTSGGQVQLEADQGNITQGVNALIDVSGGVDSEQNYGDAGRIIIRAGRDISTRLTQGTVDLQGQLQALHGDSARGGQFDLDSFSFNPVSVAASNTTRSDFSVLNSQLEAGGFSERRHIRLRSGDLLTAPTDVINVRDLVLSADAGQLTLNGAINAAGESAGRVHLAAQGDVRVNAGIDVRASGEQQKGGQINLESVAGSITVNLPVTEVIDLSGAVDGRGGELNLWAARNSTGTDINISRIQGAIVGGEHINLIGFQSSEITDGVLDSELGSGVSAARSFLSASNISSISSRLNRDENADARYANLHIGAGLDFWSAGDITLNTDIDFANTRFLSSDGVSEAEAGVLNIRAAGHLNINASLEDGFREETVPIFSINYDRLLSGESWSYGLVAGADLNSAVMLRAVENARSAKNINLARDERIRTGTGDITLAASGDLVLARNAVIYTAGRPTEINPRGSLDFFMPEFQASALDFFVLPAVEFPEAGGDLNIRTGGDINAQVDSFLVSDWLQRTGGEHSLNTILGLDAMPVSWGIDFHAFNQGVGALGGGNVFIEAGGDVNRLSVSVPTTGKQTGDIDFTYDPAAFSFSFTVNSQELTELGQGNISVQVQGDINQGLFYVGNGNLDVSAGGDIGSATTTGIQLIGADTRSRVLAGGDIYLQGIATPGLLPYSVLQNNKMSTIGASAYSSFFNTYTEQNASALFSLTGDININPQTDISLAGTRASFAANAGVEDLSAYYPGSLSLTAFNRDINIEKGFNLQPSSSGQLTMLAQGNIVSLGSSTVINMSDVSTEQLPGVEQPVSNFSQYGRFFNTPQFQHASVPVHQNNPDAVRIVTNEGDIKPLAQQSLFQFVLPRRAEVIAARDISNLNLIIQNINETDVSIVQAGRDINYLNSILLGLQGNSKTGGITLAGPGELQVLAGRNIDLGNQLGVRTVGNSFNSALGERDQGGDIYMLAGLGRQGADINGFVDTYLSAESEYAEALITFMVQRNTALTSFEQALTGFRQLDRNAQRTLVLQMFFAEIKAASIRAANELANAAAFDQLQGYTRGLEAISVLFPGTVASRRAANPGESSDDSADLIVTGGNAWQIPLENARYQGNISLTSSGIATNNGGNINLLAPGGLLNVGLTVASDNTGLDLGVISRGSGDISIYTHNDVAVNESRIQALDGGNILGWSTMGNIDAGRGARAALFLPPPTTLVDPDTGDVSVVFDATVQGSGVRSAAFSENRQPGDVVLAAPKGVIDAGDAGIDAGGGIILATTTVLNSGNIDAGGASVGVPVTDSSALGANLSLDVNSSGSSAAQSTSLLAQDISDQYGEGSVAILSVQVLGMGEDEPAEDEDPL